MRRAYYQASSAVFLQQSEAEILGQLTQESDFALELAQREAWMHQIKHLKDILTSLPSSHLFMEFTIPRMGKRADMVLLINGIIFVIEYKIGSTAYHSHAIEQVLDYALDLKNFHEASHNRLIIPILVATRAPRHEYDGRLFEDGLAFPNNVNGTTLEPIISWFLEQHPNSPIDVTSWANSAYKPTPTIVEAAKALYRGHDVKDISRSDSGTINLSRTSACIFRIADRSKTNGRKSICLMTGVPGSGKTLAGLNIATERMKAHEDEHAVFLSGNGPLVKVLREALAIDEVERTKDLAPEHRVRKGVALQKAKPLSKIYTIIGMTI